MFFLVSLASEPARRQRMIARFTDQKLPYALVEAYDRDDLQAKKYRTDAESVQARGVAACFASHLKALHALLESGADEGIVVEDDVRLIHDFAGRWTALRANIPDDIGLVALAYLVWKWDGFMWAGQESDQKNLSTMGPDMWGTQMYWIRREMAERAIESLDRPLHEIVTNDIRTSELIVRTSGGLVAYPPLGLEELSGSVIAPDDGNSNHAQAIRHFPSENYSE